MVAASVRSVRVSLRPVRRLLPRRLRGMRQRSRGRRAGASAPKAPPPVAPAPSGASRWLGPIAGLAAGLGLAALMSHFGLSEGFGSLLLIAILIMGAIFLLRAFLGRRAAPGALRYAGVSDRERGDDRARAARWNTAQGEQPETAAEAVGAAAPAFGVTRKPLPQGFDAQGFAKEAKRQYIQIQRSYDNGDRAALASVMTSEMNTEVATRARRTRQPSSDRNRHPRCRRAGCQRGGR